MGKYGELSGNITVAMLGKINTNYYKTYDSEDNVELALLHQGGPKGEGKPMVDNGRLGINDKYILQLKTARQHQKDEKRNIGAM